MNKQPHQGRQIAKAMKAFNTSGIDQFRLVGRTLLHRPFGQKHFETATAAIKTLQDAAIVKMSCRFIDDSMRPIEKRFLTLDMLSITTAFPSHAKQETFNHYVPVSTNVSMARELFVFTQRPMPVIISSHHTEVRFFERHADVLDYADPAFQDSMAYGLYMARNIIDPIINAEDATRVPVVIPHKAGLFLGYAEIHEPSIFRLRTIMSSRTCPETGKPFFEDTSVSDLETIWTPWCNTHIRTFISRKEFKPDQQRLHSLMISALTQPEAQALINTTSQRYITNCFNSQADFVDLQFQRIMCSPEWREVIRHAPANATAFAKPQDIPSSPAL